MNDVATDGVQTDTSTDGVQTDDNLTADDSQTTGNNTGATDDSQSDNTGDQTVDDGSTDQITYADFDMKEGLELDTDALALATPLFNELGLDQAGAQKLVDLQSDLVQAGAKKQVEAFNEQVATWREDSKNDSEFGGDKFDENVKLAQSAVNKFGTPELKQLLEDYGVGNHPEMIRFMVKVGRLTAEDVPGNEAGATGGNNDRVSILYPNARKN